MSVFVEEEGSRFGLACLGSRLAAGVVPWRDALALTDRDGTSFEDALSSAGLGAGTYEPWDLAATVDCFVELHVEQGRDLVDRGAAVGWPARSGRTGVTASTSPAPPTMPGRRGWRTGRTRC
ncbi:hypothetical protein [Nocardioides ungokensis]|uniref:hypothetical protein n=1 Tax=Nocardioides ungokensis TaxID=1643322 RepID=UPI001FECA8C8|nr:hypothetical protein [Nocardioides ungokensis]